MSLTEDQLNAVLQAGCVCMYVCINVFMYMYCMYGFMSLTGDQLAAVL